MTKVTTDPGIGAAPKEVSTDTIRDPIPGAIEPLPAARYRTNPNGGEITPEHEMMRRVKPAKRAGLKGLRDDALGDAKRADVRIVQRDEGLQRIAEETAEEVKARREGEDASASRKKIGAFVLAMLVVGVVLLLIVRSMKTDTAVPPPSATAPLVAPTPTDVQPPAPSPSVTVAVPTTPSASAPAPAASTSAKEPRVPHHGAIGPSTSEAPTVTPVPAPPVASTSAEPAGSAPNPWKIKEH